MKLKWFKCTKKVIIFFGYCCEMAYLKFVYQIRKKKLLRNFLVFDISKNFFLENFASFFCFFFISDTAFHFELVKWNRLKYIFYMCI